MATQVMVSHGSSGILAFCGEMACKQHTFHSNFLSHLERKQLPVMGGGGGGGGQRENPGHRGVSFHPGGPSLALSSQVCDEIKNI